jgi:thiol-disulfide isomerase/thioredoxin
MSRFARSVVVLLASSLGLTAGCGGEEPDVVLDRDASSEVPSIGTNAVLAGEPLPQLQLLGPDGAVSTAELLGRPLVINYWYSTCAPCKKELPAFAAVHGEFAERVRFVGVNPLDTDFGASFAGNRGVTYELLGDPVGEFGSALGIINAPVTLFVESGGNIVRQSGVLTESALRDAIREEFGL